MKIITKNNVTARGKQSILFLLDEKDEESFLNTITNDILSLVNCAIYCAMKKKIEVSTFSVAVIVVSDNIIENKSNFDVIYTLLDANTNMIVVKSDCSR